MTHCGCHRYNLLPDTVIISPSMTHQTEILFFVVTAGKQLEKASHLFALALLKREGRTIVHPQSLSLRLKFSMCKLGSVSKTSLLEPSWMGFSQEMHNIWRHFFIFSISYGCDSVTLSGMS